MDINQLQDRIVKKEEQIKKIEKRITKWSKELDEKSIQLVKDTLDRPYDEVRGLFYPQDPRGYVRIYDPMYELRAAYRDLNDANVTLNKYKNALNIADEKARAPKIQVIVDFLNNWKTQVSDYIHENTKIADKYYQIENERCDFHNNRYMFLKTMTEEEYRQKSKELQMKSKEYKDAIHPITAQVYKGYYENRYVDEEELDKILSKDAENKYWNLIEQVTKVTGEIEDISNLRIGLDGNLNGLVIGKDGKANIQTIGAGGYNQDIILDSGRHGQCYHYRVLVHKVQ